MVLLPLAALVHLAGAGVVTLWWAMAGWLLARQVSVALRYPSGAWLRTGRLSRRSPPPRRHPRW